MVLPKKYGYFKPPSYTDLTDEQALQRADKVYRPMYEQSRTNQGAVAQQQLAQMRQALGAKGQLGVGTLRQGALENTSGLLGSLANIDTGFNAQKSQAAENFLAQDRENKARLFQQALQQWQANRNAMEADRGFDYQQGRDKLADEQWGKSYGLQSDNALWGRKMDMTNALGYWLGDKNKPIMAKQTLDANNAYKDASLALRGVRSSGGSHKGSGGGTPKLDKNTVTYKVKTYYESWLPNNFAERGLDPAEYSKYLRYPEIAQKVIGDIGASDYSKLLDWADKQEAAYNKQKNSAPKW